MICRKKDNTIAEAKFHGDQVREDASYLYVVF